MDPVARSAGSDFALAVGVLTGTRRLTWVHRTFPVPCVVRVTGSDATLNSAFALAALGFSQEELAETGYVFARSALHEGAGAAQNSATAPHYIGPHFRWEVSGFWATVRDEIALGPAPFDAWLGEIVRTLRMESLLVRNPLHLSGGETAKVILAAHLARRPRVLVLDRVLGELDAASRTLVLAKLRRWLPESICFVMDEALSEGSDWMVSTDGPEAAWTVGHRADIPHVPEHTELHLERISSRAATTRITLDLRDIAVQRGEALIFPPVNLAVASGDLVLVQGPNGCGKTTLLEGLAGLLPRRGILTARSRSAEGGESPLDLRDVFAFSPQDPQADITELDVEREIALACGSIDSARKALTKLDFPSDLLPGPLYGGAHEDVGLRKLTSVVAATLRGRPCCLLDEPTIYLGRALRAVATRAIRRYLDGGGIVFCSTHDAEFIESLRG